MAHALAAAAVTGKLPESDWAFEFEEPAYLTIGRCYEKNGRFSGGAYMPVVRRCDEFMSAPLGKCMELRGQRAELLLELDGKVAECVAKLKAAGLQSAYLKPFVVARLNPLRFVKSKRGDATPVAEYDATIKKMIASAEKFDAGKIKAQDLAAAGGAPESE